MKTSSREQLYFDGRLLEALLHLLDGATYGYVSKRYSITAEFLMACRNGRGRRRDIRNQAFHIYHKYRRERVEK